MIARGDRKISFGRNGTYDTSPFTSASNNFIKIFALTRFLYFSSLVRIVHSLLILDNEVECPINEIRSLISVNEPSHEIIKILFFQISRFQFQVQFGMDTSMLTVISLCK